MDVDISVVVTELVTHTFLKKINAEHSLEGLMLKLELQYLDHLVRRIYLWENTLMRERLRAGEK